MAGTLRVDDLVPLPVVWIKYVISELPVPLAKPYFLHHEGLYPSGTVS